MIWPFRKSEKDSRYEEAMKAAQEAKSASADLQDAIQKHNAALDRLYAGLLPVHKGD